MTAYRQFQLATENYYNFVGGFENENELSKSKAANAFYQLELLIEEHLAPGGELLVKLPKRKLEVLIIRDYNPTRTAWSWHFTNVGKRTQQELKKREV